MTDDTLVNGLKAIFGTSAQGSAPASSALIPYMDASGNPVGLSSMANLASVLGAYQDKTNTISDLNSLTTTGKYRISNGNSVGHTPSATGNTAFVDVSTFANYTIQKYTVYNGATFSRTLDGSTWGNWSRVDNFGCATPDALASLLGASFKVATTNIDNIKEAGTWLVPSDYVEGVPDGFSVQLTMTVIKTSAGDIIQTIYRTGGGGKMAMRTSASASTWNAWKVIVS